MDRVTQPASTSTTRESEASLLASPEPLPPSVTATEPHKTPDAPTAQQPHQPDENTETVLYTYPTRTTQFFAQSPLMKDIRQNPALPSWPTADF